MAVVVVVVVVAVAVAVAAAAAATATAAGVGVVEVVEVVVVVVVVVVVTAVAAPVVAVALILPVVLKVAGLRARHTLQLSPIATRNTGPATIAGLPAANPQGLQAVCRATGRISIPARKLQCCSQSQRGNSYDPMTHSLSK